MPHDLPLVTTIAAALASAWVLGVLAQRIGLSPIVGYLLAGVVIGPHTPGFVGDVGLASQLAEGIQAIDYRGFVDLVAAQPRVQSWL